MKDKNPPSDAELEILAILWDQQPATVKSIHEAIAQHKPIGYTTVLKQMQRLYDKGLVSREKEGRQHVYSAVPQQEEVENNLLGKIRKLVFGGSSVRLAMRALGEERPSQEELDELQAWIDEQKNQKS